jgi:hypothetical protein
MIVMINHEIWITVYIYIYLEPKWPLLGFDPNNGGPTIQKMDHLGSRYVYIYTYTRSSNVMHETPRVQ